MIKNERQYKITRTQAALFASAASTLKSADGIGIHPLLHKAQIDAIESQLGDLNAEIEEYEALRESRPAIIEANTLAELPGALIRARIALGLSQKDLADKMGLKEQQVQRYESTDYMTASLARLIEVADALGVRVSENVSLPNCDRTKEALLQRLDSVGIDPEFAMRRLLPSDIVAGLDMAGSVEAFVTRAGECLSQVFGWTAAQLFSAGDLPFPAASSATARFKLPGGAQGRRLSAYIAYTHYLSIVVANAVHSAEKGGVTRDFEHVRKSLLDRSQNLNLTEVLHYLWDIGVPVLPLNDRGTFHGACWRVSGRNVIVLKHQSKFLARCVFDVLHEMHHAGEDPDNPVLSWIEESEISSQRRNSPEEQAASEFAGNVLLNGRAEAMVNECVEIADGKVERLKSAVIKVAQSEGIVVDHLANYLAFRLSLQKLNWWGAANNLQTQIGDPFAQARSVFLERFDFGKVNEVDAKLLHQALSLAD
jgi:transcriptional regulator with XRE-family HTH domain